MTVEFGYTHVSDTSCPYCGENYMAMESVDGTDKMKCWCGASCTVTFENPEERTSFIEAHKVRT